MMKKIGLGILVLPLLAATLETGADLVIEETVLMTSQGDEQVR